MSLELDLSANHQHLECSHCGTTYCAICVRVGVSYPSVHAAEASRMAKAHLN